MIYTRSRSVPGLYHSFTFATDFVLNIHILILTISDLNPETLSILSCVIRLTQENAFISARSYGHYSRGIGEPFSTELTIPRENKMTANPLSKQLP